MRRRASDALLHRIAGSAARFRTLVHVWDLDGRALSRCLTLDRDAAAAPSCVREGKQTGELGVVLSIPERRLALFQIIVEYARAGVVKCSFPRVLRPPVRSRHSSPIH